MEKQPPRGIERLHDVIFALNRLKERHETGVIAGKRYGIVFRALSRRQTALSINLGLENPRDARNDDAWRGDRENMF